ncbi:MAG: toxin-antitoxin system YwqK family antitoxin [Bacteroidota bacterium]
MGKTSGNWKYYYENGQVSSEGVLKDGKKEGDWKLWYESGKFLGEGSYSGGNGIYKEYYENGKLKLTGQMQDGEHAGEWMYYYDDGTIEGTCEYNNGVGNYTGYYQSGQLRMQGKLINGKKTGAWNMYREDGTRAAILRFYSDGEAPNAGVTELQDTSHNKVDKPYNPAVLKLTKKGNRFYSRQVNEQHGIILSFNPLGAIPLPFGLGKQGVPFSVEYRIRERLAYEFTYTFFRSPVFANHENPDPNTTLYEGFNISLRQKLCFPENDRAGSLYYGQEIRYTEVFYNTLVQDPLLPQVTLPYTGLEKKYELSFLLGMRFYKELSGKGNTAFTADLFTGLGAGIRKTNFPGKQVAFNELNRSKFTFPIRLGFTVGMFF